MRELMQATFELDDAAAPFVFLRVPESPPRELFGEALAATEARLAGATDRVILVVDLQRVRIMSTRVRTELGAWLQRVDPVLRTRGGTWIAAPVQAATVQKLEDIILTKARDLRRSTVG